MGNPIMTGRTFFCTFDVSLLCDRCGADLTAADVDWKQLTLTIRVKPCELCSEERPL